MPYGLHFTCTVSAYLGTETEETTRCRPQGSVHSILQKNNRGCLITQHPYKLICNGKLVKKDKH